MASPYFPTVKDLGAAVAEVAWDVGKATAKGAWGAGKATLRGMRSVSPSKEEVWGAARSLFRAKEELPLAVQTGRGKPTSQSFFGAFARPARSLTPEPTT